MLLTQKLTKHNVWNYVTIANTCKSSQLQYEYKSGSQCHTKTQLDWRHIRNMCEATSSVNYIASVAFWYRSYYDRLKFNNLLSIGNNIGKCHIAYCWIPQTIQDFKRTGKSAWNDPGIIYGTCVTRAWQTAPPPLPPPLKGIHLTGPLLY